MGQLKANCVFFLNFRCSKYSNVPAGCSLKPDPKDPSCCEVPYCPIVVPSIPPTPGVITPQMPQPGIITGTGKVPNLIGKEILLKFQERKPRKIKCIRIT